MFDGYYEYSVTISSLTVIIYFMLLGRYELDVYSVVSVIFNRLRKVSLEKPQHFRAYYPNV